MYYDRNSFYFSYVKLCFMYEMELLIGLVFSYGRG